YRGCRDHMSKITPGKHTGPSIQEEDPDRTKCSSGLKLHGVQMTITEQLSKIDLKTERCVSHRQIISSVTPICAATSFTRVHVPFGGGHLRFSRQFPEIRNA